MASMVCCSLLILDGRVFMIFSFFTLLSLYILGKNRGNDSYHIEGCHRALDNLIIQTLPKLLCAIFSSIV